MHKADADRTVDPDTLLVRGLGVRQLTATIFNHTVGSGIFVLPAFAVGQLGAAAAIAYLACALVMLLVVLVFAEAGSRVTATGGPYAYVEIGLGPFLGFASGVLLAASQISAAGAITMLLAQSLARLLGLAGAAAPAAIALGLVGALVAINVRGLAWGARVVELFTAAKLVPLLFFVVVGVFFISPPNLHWDSMPSAARVAATSGTLIFAFTGIETALMPSGEVRDPTRTVPLATMLALGAATLLYLAVQGVALGILGPALATDRVAPLATAAGRFAGAGGAALLLAGASVSMFGWLTGSILAGPRALFALARDGFLPRSLAAVHPRFHTPHRAIATYGVLAIAVSVTGTFEQLAVLSNLTALGVYFLGAIAVWRLRRRGVRSDREPFLMPGGAVVPVLTCLVILWIVSQTVTPRELFALGGVLVLSLLMYLAKRRGRAQGAG
ncbi:MAG TPA: APC family permease [Steroidobacteraceae bacterium]|nr:APC family permease [Steroidobacteraceae bacterium]